MNKKQVGALLKVMSKDNTRPAICSPYVDEYDGKTVVVATNGYILAAVNIYIDHKHIGKIVKREAIEVWYKLANSKSRFDSKTMTELLENNSNLIGSDFPKWQQLMPKSEDRPQDAIKFNAENAKVLQDLSGEKGLVWKLTGKLSPMTATTENGMYLMMPMKQ